MEDYKKKYEDALERCKKEFNFNNLAYSHEEIKQKLEHVFPELKESEDERIRKWLIDYFSKINDEIELLDRKKIVSWLEKQGEQKTDKIEPKFKVGDWVVYEENIYQIHNISLKKYYECLRIDGTVHTFDFEYVDSKSRLWTIQDAKDGDVLYSDGVIIMTKAIYNANNPHFISYCSYSIEYNMFQSWERDCWLAEAFVPATKEQRDLLFQKMHEVGYEWDAEKRELKKIKQKPTEWSEEDEHNLNSVINLVHNTRNGAWGSCIGERIEFWLKSLKERYAWKPSDE